MAAVHEVPLFDNDGKCNEMITIKDLAKLKGKYVILNGDDGPPPRLPSFWTPANIWIALVTDVCQDNVVVMCHWMIARTASSPTSPIGHQFQCRIGGKGRLLAYALPRDVGLEHIISKETFDGQAKNKTQVIEAVIDPQEYVLTS